MEKCVRECLNVKRNNLETQLSRLMRVVSAKISLGLFLRINSMRILVDNTSLFDSSYAVGLTELIIVFLTRIKHFGAYLQRIENNN